MIGSRKEDNKEMMMKNKNWIFFIFFQVRSVLTQPTGQ